MCNCVFKNEVSEVSKATLNFFSFSRALFGLNMGKEYESVHGYQRPGICGDGV